MSTISNTGNFPTYRFYVTFPVGSITYEVFPLNFLSTMLVDELETDQVFYRRKFSGSLIFGTDSFAIDDGGVKQNRQDDWLLFWGIEQSTPCDRIDFTITKTVSGVTTTYWEGYFSTSDGSFDIDNCTFEITPITDDDYTDILDKVDLQYNILSNTPVVTVIGKLEPNYNSLNFTRNHWLIKLDEDSVIKFLADQIKPGVTVSSEFFTDSPNYVTGSTNYLQYLTIAQKSDIARYTSSDPATVAMMSWSELMEILWAMFQVKWNYDAGTDTINVEHISWFDPPAGIDIRTQLMSQATNKYSYLKDQMPKYEKFKFMEANDLNFIGVPIWYDSACVNQDPKTNIVETIINVTTDLEFIIDSQLEDPTSISDEGFVILANKSISGNYYVDTHAGSYTGVVKLNAHLSWANLHNSYFRHNRVLIEGYLNDSLVTFWTAQKNKSQECSIILCDEFDPSESITSELGETYFGGVKGIVKKADIQPSGMIKLNLLYGPADNVNTGVDEPEYIHAEQRVDCWTIDFTLTWVSGVDLIVVMTATVRDNLGNIVCTGPPESHTITAGTWFDTHALTPCSAIPGGGCMEIVWDLSGAPGYSLDFSYLLTCGCS